MIHLKKPEEIKIIREGGEITASILKKILAEVRPGVRGKQLENLAESLINKYKVKASFRTVEDYPFALCLSLNEEVVHGLPGERKLKGGDLVSVDFGVLYKGFHTDMARTIRVKTQNSRRRQSLWRRTAKLKTQNHEAEQGSLHGPEPTKGLVRGSKELERFLETGKRALDRAIKEARVGNHVGHVSQAIQKIVEKAGYNVVKSLVGHGIGRKLHEDPPIPCFLPSFAPSELRRAPRGAPPGSIEKTPLLKEGMVLAVEVMYAQGKGEVEKRGWVMATRDGSLAGHFEETIAVTKKGPIILTR